MATPQKVVLHNAKKSLRTLMKQRISQASGLSVANQCGLIIASAGGIMPG